jgi:hypothetical protein
MTDPFRRNLTAATIATGAIATVTRVRLMQRKRIPDRA